MLCPIDQHGLKTGDKGRQGKIMEGFDLIICDVLEHPLSDHIDTQLMDLVDLSNLGLT